MALDDSIRIIGRVQIGAYRVWYNFYQALALKENVSEGFQCGDTETYLLKRYDEGLQFATEIRTAVLYMKTGKQCPRVDSYVRMYLMDSMKAPASRKLMCWFFIATVYL